MKVEAWKGYPGQPLADGSVGWWMDDEKIAYPSYEYSRKIGIKNICVHKGLPLPGWEIEHSSPRDVEKAAKDFPDLNFLIYHAGFKGVRDAMPAVNDGFKTVTNVPWISDLCAMRKRNPKMTNVYMDLGTTFGMTVITQPLLCAYMLGLMIDAFGEDHVLWGTDSIWWGSPQWQIEAFRRLQMPEDLQKRFRLQTADRPGEGKDLRFEFGKSLRHRCEGEDERDPVGLRDEAEGEISQPRAHGRRTRSTDGYECDLDILNSNQVYAR